MILKVIVEMNLRHLSSRLKSFFSGNHSVRPIPGYPSSVVDSYGCEFGFEMYYHIAYAYHLHRKGLLTKTVSCQDTSCFYWFSPNHVEAYEKRQWVADYPCIAQHPHDAPDFDRWMVPDFQLRYHGQVDFGFDKPPLLIFNKYNSEWHGPPVNFLSKGWLQSFAEATQDRFQIVYCRPTSKIVADESEMFELQEKNDLAEMGVVMVEELHELHPHLTFNALQLHLISQASLRIAVQGGATYLNALLPGDLYVLHRRGAETAARTYEHLTRLAVDKISVSDDEQDLLRCLHRDHLSNLNKSTHAA